MGEDQQQQLETAAEDLMQRLRLKATELLLREEWKEAVQVYSQFIDLCKEQIMETTHEQVQLSKLHKSLCLALSNRAEARSRLRDFNEALIDCEEALKMESTHFKALLCKGKVLLSLNRYSMALECFKATISDAQASGNFEAVNGFLEKCKKLEYQSRTGAFDLSDWILNGFRGKCPELAEYIGAVQIRKSEISGRGLFVTKNIEAGTLLFVTKAIATERGILSGEDSSENEQLVMWKNFIDKVMESISKCQRTRSLITTFSSGENENELEVPDISVFRPEIQESSYSNEKLDMGKILTILDVNSLVEDAVSANVLGKNKGLYGVGLWTLASFINHSCSPNARRIHVGDYIIVHASRDVKAGEEITFAYFDMLSPLEKRKEMSKTWGFNCNCKRCKFEERMSSKQELREIEIGLERGIDAGSAVYRLEENMKRWIVRGKEKGYLRASIWGAYSETYGTERLMKRWGRRIPTMEAVVDSVVEAVGSDERIMKGGLKRNFCGVLDLERTMNLGRGLYGKVVKKQALKSLLEMGICEQS
ncbi:Histone-lysine N-methyltransferase [Melia azedarach]|uniref:Histone-lysine N-methyltransferase n=1 Tax=Melia azedarach TaxID=155640 RepID=A0ACC1XK82_MELAZ|nr:Histone-lysine N-methyltransferase [Melia azedarach]